MCIHGRACPPSARRRDRRVPGLGQAAACAGSRSCLLVCASRLASQRQSQTLAGFMQDFMFSLSEFGCNSDVKDVVSGQSPPAVWQPLGRLRGQSRVSVTYN